MELVRAIYQFTDRFPPGERNGLTADLRRSAVSVPSLLAEGSARMSRRGLVNYVDAARGALAQVETQIAIAYQLEFIGHNADLDQRIGALFDKLKTMTKVLLEEQKS